jgi:zinc D-Ala-D-Ala carboxypeptidase
MKYFKLSEFDSPDILGSGKNMNEEFLYMLDAARKIYGKPMHVNSGYRSEEHNKKVGGVSSSSHLKGLAADISCKKSNERFEMLQAFIKAGFKRIGVADSFIHIDNDKDKSQGVIWTY